MLKSMDAWWELGDGGNGGEILFGYACGHGSGGVTKWLSRADI